MVAVTATILDGKATRDEIFEDLKVRVSALKAEGITPGLGTILVGDDPGSAAYVRGKHNDCAKVGINSLRRDLPADITQEQLNATIDELNANPECTGYIVQLPLPKHLDENAALERIDPDKDADGLHPVNLGRLVLGKEAPLPCTPRGILHLLRRYEVPIAGAHVVVVGRGVTVGRPIGLLLTRRSENATVTLCHTGTRDLAAEVRRADIIVAAAGVPGLITADMVKPGAAVLDVGVSRTDDGLRGDVAADVSEVACFRLTQPRWCRTADPRVPDHQRGRARRAGSGRSLSPMSSLVGLAKKNLPMLAVLAVIAAAVVLVLADRWRRGALVFGVAVIIGAAARWFVPENRVGLLAVRGRVFDTAAMGVMGVLIATLALTIDPLGTD